MSRGDAPSESDHCPPIDTRRFDGVICFGGEDWWYHNRGHFDMQMMRRFAHHVPVIYVNSIGMRTPHPREGRMFVSRITRKLRSVRQGLVRVNDRFTVLSPFFLPGRIGTPLLKRRLARVVQNAMREIGIRHPLVWVACPTAAEILDDLHPTATVYQRTDRYENFSDVEAERIRRYDRWLKRRSDLTVFCARQLFETESHQCAAALRVDHGVDFEQFSAACAGRTIEPDDVAPLSRPRVGFVGGIDMHTFDPDLFRSIARSLPDVHFVLVGSCSLATGWCNLANVSLLGKKSHEDVPAYMAACDVLIMPWRQSSWIEACNPVKLKEYLAVGRPIVSTPFRELDCYGDLVQIASDAKSFAQSIRTCLATPGDADARRAAVRGDTWDARAAQMLTQLHLRGIAPFGTQRLKSNRDGSAPANRRQPPSAQSFRIPEDAVIRELKPAPVPAAMPDLAAFLLLDGGPSRSSYTNRQLASPLDAILGLDLRLLDRWLDLLSEIERARGTQIPVRILHDHAKPSPWPDENAAFRFERDARILRGTAGLVRDACREYARTRHVLVAEAARCPTVSLLPLCAHHQATGADVTIAINSDRTPAGLFVISCASIMLAPAVGYGDLKEQFLPALRRASGRIELCALPGFGAVPVRSSIDVPIAAALLAHTVNSCSNRDPGALSAQTDDCFTFSKAEAGAIRLNCATTLVQSEAEMADARTCGAPSERPIEPCAPRERTRHAPEWKKSKG